MNTKIMGDEEFRDDSIDTCDAYLADPKCPIRFQFFSQAAKYSFIAASLLGAAPSVSATMNGGTEP